jgi:hypothetical protein
MWRQLIPAICIFTVYHHLTECIWICNWWSHFKVLHFQFFYPLFLLLVSTLCQILLLLNSGRFVSKCNTCTLFSDSGLHLMVIQWSLLGCLVYKDKQNIYVHVTLQYMFKRIESHEVVLVLPEEEKYTCKSGFTFQM